MAISKKIGKKTLFCSSTLKVQERKVLLDFDFWPILFRYGHLSDFYPMMSSFKSKIWSYLKK